MGRHVDILYGFHLLLEARIEVLGLSSPGPRVPLSSDKQKASKDYSPILIFLRSIVRGGRRNCGTAVGGGFIISVRERSTFILQLSHHLGSDVLWQECRLTRS